MFSAVKFYIYRLESLNMGWTGLCKQSVVVLCVCLPQNVVRLNLSGCRENLSDEGTVLFLCTLRCEFKIVKKQNDKLTMILQSP